MPRGERTCTDHMNIVVDGLAGDFIGCLKERPDIHIKAQISEGGCNNFLSAVMPVLAHFRHQYAWTSAFCCDKGRNTLFDHGENFMIAHRFSIDSLDGLDAGGMPAKGRFHGVGYFANGCPRSRGVHGQCQ